MFDVIISRDYDLSLYICIKCKLQIVFLEKSLADLDAFKQLVCCDLSLKGGLFKVKFWRLTNKFLKTNIWTNLKGVTTIFVTITPNINFIRSCSAQFRLYLYLGTVDYWRMTVCEIHTYLILYTLNLEEYIKLILEYHYKGTS